MSQCHLLGAGATLEKGARGWREGQGLSLCRPTAPSSVARLMACVCRDLEPPEEATWGSFQAH